LPSRWTNRRPSCARAPSTCRPTRNASASPALVARRRAGEPVAYLRGTREFWSLRLRVTADVLVPRPETEGVVEAALARVPADADWRVLDLGTGSGAIALAIARERPSCLITGTDASAAGARRRARAMRRRTS
jgi:release factor glutamine methyltransferase